MNYREPDKQFADSIALLAQAKEMHKLNPAIPLSKCLTMVLEQNKRNKFNKGECI